MSEMITQLSDSLLAIIQPDIFVLSKYSNIYDQRVADMLDAQVFAVIEKA